MSCHPVFPSFCFGPEGGCVIINCVPPISKALATGLCPAPAILPLLSPQLLFKRYIWRPLRLPPASQACACFRVSSLALKQVRLLEQNTMD